MTSITTTYADGIYKDADSDIIRVENGKAEVIGTYHAGQPYINMRRTWKIADLPTKPLAVFASDGSAPVPAPEPTLPDGIYREDGSVPDTFFIQDGKAVEVLATTDGCATEQSGHQAALADLDLKSLTRLVAPTPEEVKPTVPVSGVYADKDGDIVQFKGNQMRYIYPNGPGGWFDADEDVREFGPYVPLVEEDSSK